MAFLEPEEKRAHLIGQVILFGIWAAVTGFGIYLSPNPHGHGTHEQLGLPPCPSVLFFNRPCPGCGLTTSWTSTIHGHFVDAFKAHPLGPILYLAFTAMALINIWAFAKRLRVNTGSRRWSIGIVAGAVIFFGFGIARFILVSNYAAPDEVMNFVKHYNGK